MKPVEIALPVDVVVKVRPCPGACVSGTKCGHIVTPETEIEIGRVPVRRARQSIQVSRAADAAIRRAVRAYRRCGGRAPRAWRPTCGALVGVAVVAICALDDRAGAQAVGFGV